MLSLSRREDPVVSVISRDPGLALLRMRQGGRLLHLRDVERENLSFPEAIRYLADRAGIEIHDSYDGANRGTKRTRLMDVCDATAAFYHMQLMRGHDGRAREYFAFSRHGAEVCRRYPVGFAPGHEALVRHLGEAGFTAQEMIDANVAVKRGRGLADRFFIA